jgi:Flp pilus assembly protein protease CpaA
MPYLDWIISLAALAWLIAVAVFDIRTRKVPNPLWTGIPLLAAVAIRVLNGTAQWMAAVAVIAVVISERRHLQQKMLEALVLAAGVVAIVWIFFIADVPTQSGIAGVVVFWLSWELHYIGGADAMTLITCVLIWPNIEFLLAYLAAGLIWSLGARIKQGNWLKFHPVPGLAVVATAGFLYLIYQVYLAVKI